MGTEEGVILITNQLNGTFYNLPEEYDDVKMVYNLATSEG